LKKTIWQHVQVEIVHCDMRDYKPDEKADILVSELLGSFGDNELSPECLDGAQHFLKKNTGISIPCESRSFIAPLSSNKFYKDVRAFNDPKYFESPYVVKIHQGYVIDEPQEVFTFVHPNPAVNERTGEADNSRYQSVKFSASVTCVMHGLVGYFDSKLFDQVYLSILPSSKSEGMFSWFPIAFPIKQPILVQKGDVIEVHFWRHTSKTRVWYEWSVSILTTGYCSAIHNVNGKCYSIDK